MTTASETLISMCEICGEAHRQHHVEVTTPSRRWRLSVVLSPTKLAVDVWEECEAFSLLTRCEIYDLEVYVDG